MGFVVSVVFQDPGIERGRDERALVLLLFNWLAIGLESRDTRRPIAISAPLPDFPCAISGSCITPSTV